MALEKNRVGFIVLISTFSPRHLVILSLFLLAGCGGATAPEDREPSAKSPANTSAASATASKTRKPTVDAGGRVTLHVPGMTKRLKLE